MNTFSFRCYIRLLLILVLLSGCRQTQGTETESPIRTARISAHRGGPDEDHPENALETLRHTAERIPGVMLEVDLRSSRDGELVLLHDRTLDRTTDLSGAVDKLDWDELRLARIVGPDGRDTGYGIPRLAQVCDWIKGEDAFLSLDVKDISAYRSIVDMIREYELVDRVEIITYTIPDAQRLHEYAPEVYISMSIGSQATLDKVLQTDIDPSRVAAFTGLTLKDETFYRRLKEAGMVVTLGTLGNLDRRSKASSAELYPNWAKSGIDRFATDRPFAVYAALQAR